MAGNNGEQAFVCYTEAISSEARVALVEILNASVCVNIL